MSESLRKFERANVGRGFGLIELVITISIIAILAVIALPSFSYTIRSNRVRTQANDLMSAFNIARNEAITRSRSVTICAADTRTALPDECGSAADWKNGWIVFVDETATGAPGDTIEATEILRSWTGNQQNTLTAGGNATYIRFTSRGEAQMDAPLEFTLKPDGACQNHQQRRIEINTMGRFSSTAVECS